MGAKCCRSAGDYVAVDNAEGTGEADHTPPNGQFAAHSVGCLGGTRPSVAQVLLAAPQNNYTGWEGGRPITTSQILSDSTVHALCLSHGAPTQVEKNTNFLETAGPREFPDHYDKRGRVLPDVTTIDEPLRCPHEGAQTEQRSTRAMARSGLCCRRPRFMRLPTGKICR